MNQRIMLWAALGALVVSAAGGAVVIAGGDDGDGGAPRLPVAVASAGEESTADGATEPADAAAIGIAPTTYVADDGLPTLGGEAPAYRLPVDVPAERVSELATALGIAGEPESSDDGSWVVEDGERRLDVYGPGNTWTSYPATSELSISIEAQQPAGPDTPVAPDDGSAGGGASGSAATGGGASGNTGSGVRERAAAPTTTIVCVTTPCEPPVEDPPHDPTGPATTTAPDPAPDPGSTDPALPTEPAEPGGPVPDIPPCVPGPVVLCPADAPILDEPLPGLPTEDEAIAIATALLESAGVDVGDARTTASGGIAEWYVEAEPTLGGVPAPGLSSSVTVGVDGEVVFASGPAAPPDELGDYALLSTADAVDRLNEAGSVWATGGSAGAAEVIPGAEAGTAPGPTSVTDAPAIATSQPRGKRHQGGVPTRPPGGPPMTPGTALPPDPTVSDPDGPTTDPAAPTTIPGATVRGDPGSPPTEPAVPPTSAVDPGGPGPAVTTGPVEPAPTQEIVLTGAELVLISVPSWNETGSYLVPGYRFTDAAGIQATVAAVVDDALLPPS